MIIVDAHQDIAYNMLSFGRDYTLPTAEIRRREEGTEIPGYNGNTLLSWSEYQRGKIAVIFATLFASPLRLKAFPAEVLVYADAEQAHKLYRNQVDVYRRLCEDHPDKFRLIPNKTDLRETLLQWETQPAPEKQEAQGEEQVEAASRFGSNGSRPHGNSEEETTGAAGVPVGLVMLMEGAEGVRAPSELPEWWESGVRLVGPAWAGTRFCGGTNEPGPLTAEGFALLEAMGDLGFGLDISHMDEKAALQALDFYTGHVFASHSNVRSLLKWTESNRNLSDRVITGLIERDGVIGIVPANSFLRLGWQAGDRASVSLHDVAAHIDFICQLAGDSRHVGLGSDFDGGFGVEAVPAEIDTIADLQKLAPLLSEKGYANGDIARIFAGNWLELLEKVLPEA